jgi:hypothetical protein
VDAALLAPAVAAATAAGTGGPPVLFELPFGMCNDSMLFARDNTAHSCKMGVVLMHPGELAKHQPIGTMSVVSFVDLTLEHGAPAAGGSRYQLVSAARWQHVPVRDGTSEGDMLLAVRFWLREARLQAMLRDDWRAHIVSTDTWQALARSAAPLSGGRVVRRLSAAADT